MSHICDVTWIPVNALIPKHLDKNEAKRQSIQRPELLSFVPPSPELPETKDNKHAINVRINKETKEHVSVFHGGILETYLQYFKIYRNLVLKKDLYTTFNRYEKEETLAQEDIDKLDISTKPDANDPSEEVVDPSSLARFKKKSPTFTPCDYY